MARSLYTELPLESQSCHRVYSVEAVQHFPDLTKFCQEASRVLRNEGTLNICTYFLKDSSAFDQAKGLIHWLGSDFEPGHNLEQMKVALQIAGFERIEIKSIGENVWKGFDRWISQSKHNGTIEKNWLVSYEQDLIDYYLIRASKK